MPKNWIAFATGVNGGPSGANNSGLVDTQQRAEECAAKAMQSPQVFGVSIAKVHSKAKRVDSPVQFIGVSDIVAQDTDEAEAA
jgi:hypothetical protein